MTHHTEGQAQYKPNTALEDQRAQVKEQGWEKLIDNENLLYLTDEQSVIWVSKKELIEWLPKYLESKMRSHTDEMVSVCCEECKDKIKKYGQSI